MRGSRPRQSLDISDLDFDLSLDLDLRGRIFKIAITRSISNGRGYCTSVLVMFKKIKKYFFFFISCFYLVKWPSYFTLCENGYFTKMCTTVHKINFFNFFFQNLKIYYIEMVQFIFEGSRTNFSFWSKFAYVLVRTGVGTS